MTATSLSTTDVLTHWVVTFLTPMFLAATCLDLEPGPRCRHRDRPRLHH
jgi:hypothetical protein